MISLPKTSLAIFSCLSFMGCGGSSSGTSEPDPIPEQNNPPTITAERIISFEENSNEPVYIVLANDIDGDSLQFSLVNNKDSSLFQINSDSGELAFLTPPDFEQAMDFNQDNIYAIDIVVEDSKGASANHALEVTVTDRSADYRIEVTYPSPNANLGGAASSSALAGKIIDLEQGALPPALIDTITVNGLPANINGNSWRTRLAEVPAELNIDIHAELANQTSVTHQQKLYNQPLIADLYLGGDDTLLDLANMRLLASDSVARTILSVNLETGERSILSGKGFGIGPLFNSPHGIELLANENALLVTDTNLSQSSALVKVDLNTGNRTLISHEGKGSGILFERPDAITLPNDPNNPGVAYILEGLYGLSALLSVDINSGNRTVVSDSVVGTGPYFSNPSDIVIDSIGARAIVADSILDVVFTVDLNNGNREVLADLNPHDFFVVSSLELNVTNNQVLVADAFGSLAWIDIDTGSVTKLPEPTDASSIALTRETDSYALDQENDKLYFIDKDSYSVVKRDMTSHICTPVSESHVGGAPFSKVWSFVYDSENNRILTGTSERELRAFDLSTGRKYVQTSTDTQVVGDPTLYNNDTILTIRNPGSLLGINTNTGSSNIWTSSTLGTGPDIQANNLALHTPSNFVYAVGTEDVYSVDLTTRDRKLISNIDTGSGPDFGFIEDAVVNQTGDTLFIADRVLKAILSVDVITGERRIISDMNLGTGPAFAGPLSVVLDEIEDYILVGDQNVLYRVSVSTGNRTPIAVPGMEFLKFEKMVLDKDNDRLFFHSGISNSIGVIDMYTSEIALILR